MSQPNWKTFEDQIQGIATLIFGQTCEPGRLAGVNFDGIVRRSDLETVCIEVSKQFDLEKVREGVTRLALARQALVLEGDSFTGLYRS